MSQVLCLPARSVVPIRDDRAEKLSRESDLVEKCLRGDDSAWEILVSTQSRRVYRLCYRYTGNRAAAEDLTQEVFIRVFRTLHTFRSAEAFISTWLTRLTRNLLIDHYRRSADERLTSSFDDQLAPEPVLIQSQANPERALAAREARDLVQSILLRLPPDLREPIIFRDLEDMDYREIALVVGIPVGTVKSRLNRGRAELARLTRKYRKAA